MVGVVEESGVGVRRDIVGNEFRSFELLFILRWEIVPLFVSNEKLLLNFVFFIPSFVFYEKNVSYARIL